MSLLLPADTADAEPLRKKRARHAIAAHVAKDRPPALNRTKARQLALDRVRDKPDQTAGNTGNKPGTSGGNNGPRNPDKPNNPDKPGNQAGKPPRNPPGDVVVKIPRLPPVSNRPRPPVVVDLPPIRRPLPSPGIPPVLAPPLAFVPALPPIDSGGGQPPRFVPPPAFPPPFASGSSPSLQTLDAFVPDEVLITVASTAPQTLESDVAQAFNVLLVERTPLPLINVRLVRLRIPDSRTVPAVVAAIGADPRIALVQPNFLYRPSGDADAKPHLVAAAHTGLASNIQYALAAVNVIAAQRLANGRGTRIAVIDSGIDRAHPDFSSAKIEEFDATDDRATTAVSDDRHGTGIVGIIAARGTMLGIAPDASVLSARVFRAKVGQAATSTTMNIVKGVTWSSERGARVLNMSFSGPRDALVQRHIEAIVANGIVPVAAAGNGGPDAAPSYPAAYDNVIAVTAIDASGQLYDKANRGGYVVIAAPGVDVIVPGEGQSHEFQSGTSYAAAHITGVIALMLEVNPQLSPAATRTLLEKASDDLGTPGRDEKFGYGRVDAERAVRLAVESKSQ